MNKGTQASVFVAVVLSTTSMARPDERSQAASAIVAKAMQPAVARRKVPDSAPKRPPELKLTIQTPTISGPWTMRVTNEGDIPVRIEADARLLSLDVSPRSARVPVRCELPADMRPSSDLEHALVVPPKRSYAEDFEPRLYCFGRKMSALAPGAIVVAHLGWTSGPRAKPPFAASPIEDIEPAVAPLKSIDALPIALPDEPPVRMAPRLVYGGDVEADTPRLALQGPATVDAVFPNEIEIPVTLRNDSERAAVVRFRPEVLGFDVIGSGRVEHCKWPTQPAAAQREMFTTLPPKGTETLDVSLRDYCSGEALADGGMLIVRPWMDTTNAPGAVVGLRSFDGTVVAMTPTVVRLHRGTAPPPPLLRRRLELAP